jgi:hypothetical protein
MGCVAGKNSGGACGLSIGFAGWSGENSFAMIYAP